jgi:hypothetical protein
MTLNDAALVTGATAIKNEITHMQLHSTNVGGTWATGAIGTRLAVAAAGTVDADGDITWDTTANTAGEYTVTSITETSTAT